MENEIRKDYLLDRWVIISPKRSKRPHKQVIRKTVKFDKNCPFCPGNEKLTPPSIISKPSEEKWKIRVFENKYPALTKDVVFESKVGRMKTTMKGYGSHLMVVDTPKHNLHPGLFSLEEWELWFETLRDIFYQQMRDENIKFVLFFKNHGLEAGASQSHPHTQVIALPTVPFLIWEELKKADDYYTMTGRCPFCDIIKLESKEKKRIVFENKHVIVFCPYAPLWPYEAWIFPKEHIPSIEMRNETRKELLKVLGNLLKTYYKKLNDPPFNFYIHMAYGRMTDHIGEKYHFHIEVAPRLERDAGFELGAGMNITTVSPEEAAEFLRKGFGK